MSKQIEIEFINGLTLIGSTKRVLIVDLIATLLIASPSDLKLLCVKYFNDKSSKIPLQEIRIDIGLRIDYLIENEFDNNILISRLSNLNSLLSDIESKFVSAYVNWMIFSRHELASFDLSNSNAFLYTLSVVNKIKGYYLNNETSFIDENKQLSLIRDCVNKMTLSIG